MIGIGIGIPMTQGAGIPSWVPAGSVAAYNALTGEVWRTSKTFTRATTGYAFVAGDLLQSFAIDTERRVDNIGVLLEPAATNIWTRSSNVSTGNWVKVNATIAVDDTTGPSGLTTAEKVTATAAGAVSVEQTPTGFAGSTVYWLSVMAKLGTSGYAGFSWNDGLIDHEQAFNLTTGAASVAVGTALDAASSKICANGFIQLKARLTTQASIAGSSRVKIMMSDTAVLASGAAISKYIHLDFAQAETGSKVTSPIITGASSVLRAADVLTLTPENGSALDWHARYDDDSEDVFASDTVGALAVNPANLTRSIVEVFWATL